MIAELERLRQANLRSAAWKQWGPYLSERQWGTVREDYTAHGDAWRCISHEQARSKAYRWGEEGIGGFSDDRQLLCVAFAFWNERDSCLKERLFGLTGPEGNHGEDVKEHYYYLDATPTHSYNRMLYKYPQAAFPYERLITENRRRTRLEPEYELTDSGVFRSSAYFDIFIECAKASPDDLLFRVTAWNRSANAAPLHILPTLWFRRTSDTRLHQSSAQISCESDLIAIAHPVLGNWRAKFDGKPDLLFCDNESNTEKLYKVRGGSQYPKDGINDFVVLRKQNAVNPGRTGTKAAAHYQFMVPAGRAVSARFRLTATASAPSLADYDNIFDSRIREADEFYGDLQSEMQSDDARAVQRQALAGMLWTKQVYFYDVATWLNGDEGEIPPPPDRRNGRNRDWQHLSCNHVLSMPDKWEYPWFAAWDTAFHCIPLAMVDPDFAKDQLLLLTREWFMHPNGQLPAYEWNFSDVNPPVHAWATWRVYKMDRKHAGRGDISFLERVYHKLLLNFTWWVNRKDTEGNNIFQGGFLGLDNIGVFDRSATLPTGGHIEQSDGTSWMAMYCLNMMRIALELSSVNPSYQDMATKFFEHFLRVAAALTNLGGQHVNLWDEQDEFFYDVLHLPDHTLIPLRIRSIVGLIPMFAVETLEPEFMITTPLFKERTEWLLENKPDMASLVSRWTQPGMGERRLLSLLRGRRLKRLLRRMLDETEFLSDYGVRALSKAHLKRPYEFHVNGEVFKVSYQPAEADTALFGGNSNWRGPIWMPMNYLIIESLQKFYHYYGPDFKVECPTGSGNLLTLLEISEELTRRLSRIFLRDDSGRRAVFGESKLSQNDPHFRDHLLFYEYFHGENGRGLGASHQTGWTGLIAKLLSPRSDRTDRHATEEAHHSVVGAERRS